MSAVGASEGMIEPGLSIDRTSTALVVVDLQKGIVGIPCEPYAASAVVANAARLADGFRTHHLPVFLVRVTPSSDGKDALRPIADVPPPWPASRPPEWGDLVPELGPAPGDFIITKRQWGAFHGTELDLQLRRRKIDTIVLCGIATNAGVESTARFAFEYGYQQIFVEDACAARRAADHRHSMTAIFPRLGRVRKTADIVASFG